MTQTAIPFHFMRGGTSRGPYMNRADLPENREDLARVLVSMVGSGHPPCPGTVADGIMARPNEEKTLMKLEHPMGILEVIMETRDGEDGFEVMSAGLVRTARQLARGEVFVPKSVWS